MKIKVDIDNERLDKYLTKVLDMSRSKIQKIIKDGAVTLNGKTLSSNYLTSIGDELDVNLVEQERKEITPLDVDIDIPYEDDYLLIVNKPSGLVVHPAPGHHEDTLVNALSKKFKLSDIDSLRPGIVHRIDKDTSGLMLVAKDNKTHEALSLLIKDHKVERTYYALVEGVINHDTGTIDAPIGRDTKNRQKMMVTDKNSKEAITNFKVLERFNNRTLVECKLETGRTHQIRVHFNYINHPVVGDPIYGRKNSVTSFGQYLHSKSIRFVHPITKKEIFVDSELPCEFNSLLEELRNNN